MDRITWILTGLEHGHLNSKTAAEMINDALVGTATKAPHKTKRGRKAKVEHVTILALPKRRGRPAGSKNKTRTPVVVTKGNGATASA